MSDAKLAEAVVIMKQVLGLDSANLEEVRRVASELVNKLQGCGTCDTYSYSCPIRRESQWVWRDVHVQSQGCSCVECGEAIPRGDSCISVTCHYKNKVVEGYRCTFCHKVSLDYCSQLGHLRETVRNKTGMDYVSGEFDDE